MDNKSSKSNLHYNKALEYVKESNISCAIIQLKLSLNLNPRDPEILNITGFCYYLRCQFALAEKLWSKSISIKEEDNEAHKYLELIRDEEFEIVIERYNQIINSDNQQDKLQQIKFMKEIIYNYEELIAPYIVLGLLYMDEKDYREALIYFTKAFDKDKGDSNIQKYILACEKEVSNQGRHIIKKIMTASFVGLVLLISLLVGQNYFFEQKAEVHQQVIAEYSKENNTSETEIGNLYRKIALLEEENGEQKLIISELESTSAHKSVQINELENESNFIVSIADQILFNSAIEYYAAKDYQQALIIFKNVYNNSDKEYLKRESVFFLARIYKKLNKYEQAKDKFYEYIEKYPDTNYYDDSLYNLGLLLSNKGEIQESKRILNMLIDNVNDSQFINSNVKNILNQG